MFSSLKQCFLSSMFHCNHISSFDSSRIPSMASSSTSSVPKNFKYDVFLSFRGEDTRHTFVDHLYNALQQKNILTYKDDEKIKKGERIRDDLFTSIEESRFYIIVFSKTYASSSWCLEELVKIMECQKMTEHTAYPVFYHVEPTDVRKQSGVVGEAFAKHENEEAARKWRDALKDASHLAGWEYKNNGENKFIQQIVHEISLELRSINFIVDEKLVGMETRRNEIVSSLETSSNDVRMFGIVGMGGAGKTTLARAVYDKISYLFEGKSFVANVREVSNSLSGLTTLQKQVISDVSKDQSVTVSNVFDGKEQIIKLMRCRKVLVVLDDVDDKKQLEALAGDCNWFKPGSRIIITTRDKQVLISHRVLYDDVSLLTKKEAICLLSKYAFGTETLAQGYKELSRHIVRYAVGLPLTIKVLGSNLCGEDEGIWRDVIEELKEIPLEETQNQLKLSYNGLKDQHKEIFLDVACIMKGWLKDHAIRALDSCGFHARNGLRVLELKSLITTDRNQRLDMHDHIEEMGMNIVCRHCKPHKRSRLWNGEEIEEVLAKDLGTEATTCIKLTMKTFSKIDMKGFRKMENLRFLHLSPREYKYKDEDEDEVSQYFPNALRCLFWESYMFRCLPNTFRAKNLIQLEMQWYKGKQLWESGGREVLDKLKFLVLDNSCLTTLNLRVTPNLEILSLNNSSNLKELLMPEKLQKLKYLALTNSSLKSLDLEKTPNLETLDFKGCFTLEGLHLPDECPTLKTLILGFETIKSFDLGKTKKLETLWLMHRTMEKDDGSYNKYHKPLHPGCPNLSTIDLWRSPNLKELHVELSNVNNLVKLHIPNELRELKSLYLKHPMLVTLNLGQTLPNLEPSSLKGCDKSEENHMFLKCQNLRTLDLHCSKLKTLNLEMNPNLETVYIHCLDLIHTFGWASKLKSLEIRASENLETLDLCQAVNLETLKLEECHNLVKLDMPVKQSKLKKLHINFSMLSSFDLGLAPNLENIYLGYCNDLVEVHMHIGYPKLKSLEIHVSKNLEILDLCQAVNLETLKLGGCHNLVKLDMPVKQSKLITLHINVSMLSSFDLGMASNLEKIFFGYCYDLVEVHMHVGYPKLRSLSLDHLPKLRTLDFAMTPNLQDLTLEGCNDLVLRLPLEFPNLETLNIMSYSTLKTLKLQTPSLRNFSLQSCSQLTELVMLGECPMLKYLLLQYGSEVPSYLGGLGCLENLVVISTKMKLLPDSICMLEGLKVLKFDFCLLLEKLPENLGRLECLEELTLRDCKSLQDISSNIGKMKSLRTLSLRGCTAVEKLPEELGSLENLKELDIQYTGISHLPESIVLYKDLRIIGSKRLLKSCRFTSQKETPGYETFYYRGTHSSSLLYRAIPTTGDSFESLKRQKLSIEEV